MKTKKVKFGKSGNKNCPFEVRWTENGKTKRKRFKIKFDALAFFEKMQAEYHAPEELQISMADRIFLHEIIELRKSKNLTNSDVISILNNYVNPNICTGKDWSVATREYFLNCEKRNLRQNTIDGYITMVSIFQRNTDVENIAEVSKEMAKEFLNNISSPVHYQRALRPLFQFCIDKGWLNENPFADVKFDRPIKERSLASVLTIEATKNLFANLPKEWQPEFAIMAFAGVRPMELLYNPDKPKDVVKIGDIDFENLTIRIRASVAKTRRERLLTHLPDNLWAWLEPLKNKPKNKNVCFGNYDQNYKTRKKFGVADKDILRHSFGSYGYHYLGAELTIEIMGHEQGFSTFAKHYKGLSNPTDAKKYFEIVP
jgi:hypothetical protein